MHKSVVYYLKEKVETIEEANKLIEEGKFRIGYADTEIIEVKEKNKI